MKKFNIYTLAMLSVASLGFVGCESVAMEEDSAPKAESATLQTITVTAEQGAATKVAIAKGWDMSWEDGEQLGGYSVDSNTEDWYGTDGDWDGNSALNPFTASNVSADGSKATFTGDKASGCELRLVYPYVEGNEAFYYGIEYTFELASIDVYPAADAYAAVKENMVMVSDAVDVVDGESFAMQHVTAYLDIAVDNAEAKSVNVTSIEFAPAADSEVEFTTKAMLDLREECTSSSFYKEKDHGEYTINFGDGLAIATDASAEVNVPILPFEFPAGESFVATVYFKIGETQYYAVNTKTNNSDEAKDVVAGAYSTLTLSTANAVAILPAEITSATIPTDAIKINAAQLVVASANAAELGYMIEESEEFDGVDVTADYVVDHSDGDATPEGTATFADAYTFDVNWLSPGAEYTIYVYAKGIEGSVVISDPVVLTAASLPAMSVTEGEITTTSVTFTPGYENDYFGTVAYDCFLAEYDGSGYTASTIIGDSSNKRIYNNSKEPITIEDLEPGKEYIVRLAGSVKVGYNTYYTSADLKFTTEDIAGPVALADAQVFEEVSITSNSYNKTQLTFVNDAYEVVFQFNHANNYAPALLAGTYELFDGEIIKISDGSRTAIECEDESSLEITIEDGVFMFEGKMLTPVVADPAEATDTDNKYLDFECMIESLDFPMEIVETEALSIPADNAYSFFTEGYASNFGLYLKLDEELTPETTEVYSAAGTYVQRYQAGSGNVLVGDESKYDVGLVMFEVSYDAENEVYTLSNGSGETADGSSFTIAQELTIDPTNVAASEVTVDLTAITAASGVNTKTDSDWGAGNYDWASKYTLNFSSDLTTTFEVVVNKTGLSSEPSTEYIPSLSFEDGEGYYDDIDDVEINCILSDGSELEIENSEIVKIVKDGDNYTITIEFVSTSNNSTYTATYSGPMCDGFSCDLNDKSWY